MWRFALFAALPLVGCGEPTEPSVRRAAWLGHAPQITAPDTVRVGVPFSATVVAAIGATGYCTQPDGATVSNDHQVARVELHVRENRSQSCPSDAIRFHPQPVTLTFGTPGVATIRAIGELLVDNVLVRDSVQRTVVVVP